MKNTKSLIPAPQETPKLRAFDIHTKRDGTRTLTITFTYGNKVNSRIFEESFPHFETLIELGNKMHTATLNESQESLTARIEELTQKILTSSYTPEDVKAWIAHFETEFTRVIGRPVVVNTKTKAITIGDDTLEPVITRHIMRMISQIASRVKNPDALDADTERDVLRSWNSLATFINKLYGHLTSAS